MGKVNNILFVCTSNACRSVMAELIMGKLLEKKHISEVQVRSRGLVALFPGSCLENFMDRGAWWATVHGVAKSRTRLQ